ncbi:hypothetical protein [Nocardia sp. NBC_00403]
MSRSADDAYAGFRDVAVEARTAVFTDAMMYAHRPRRGRMLYWRNNPRAG